jgi:hypothetical protein
MKTQEATGAELTALRQRLGAVEAAAAATAAAAEAQTKKLRRQLVEALATSNLRNQKLEAALEAAEAAEAAAAASKERAAELTRELAAQGRAIGRLEGRAVALEGSSLAELGALRATLASAAEEVSRRLHVGQLLANIGADLKCPITQERMVEPVVAADGHSYERGAMEAWLREHESSPLTGEPLAHRHLVPNSRLKSLLAELSCDLPSA